MLSAAIILLALTIGDISLVRINKTGTKQALALVLAALIAAITLDLVINYPLSVFSYLAALISVFRIINILRLLHGKKQPDYLDNIYLNSAKSLGGFMIYLLAVSAFFYFVAATGWTLVALLVISQFLVICVLAGSLIRNYRKTSLKGGNYFVKANDLPSLSVAIPARNETIDLEECLNSLIESDYPKLEILVLDDCSQTKHTPEVIKRYAQAGVVFIEGKEPPTSWSAKNYAYEQLLENASSDLILFCGVDARFNKNSLRLMVEVLRAKDKKMISFMPQNSDTGLSTVPKLAVQPWRYFFELSLPRKILKRPPVLSTCWLIYAADLKNQGGFKAVTRNILPERYFARQLIKENNEAYSFMRTLGSELDFKCQKDYTAQLSTANRTLYPMIGSRLEHVLPVTLFKVSVFTLPFVLFVTGLILRNWPLAAMSLINYLICAVCFFVIVKLTYGKSDYLALLFMPVLSLFDDYLTINSMYNYEFNEVIWKDRDVCIPLMRSRKLA